MNKKIVRVIIGLLVIGIAAFFYTQSLSQSVYVGIPTVSCQDDTKPIVQKFTFTLHITIDGRPYPLNATIGHDYGNCLHEIYTNDASGKIFVAANDRNTYSLGQFFDVWRKTFTDTQIMQYPLHMKDQLHIFVNGKQVTTGRNTPLLPQEKIQIIYE